MTTPLICQQCLLPFVPQHHSPKTAIFCSVVCRDAARQNSLVLACDQCQQPFKVKAYRKDSAKFCSQACKRLSMVIPDAQATCAQCDKPFLVSVNKHGKQATQFCSQECRFAYVGQHRRGRALHTFWARVEICQHGWDCPYCCWPFMGTLDLNGYGRIIVNNRQTYAHRTAWELHNNQTLPSHLKAAHYCHFTSCTNFDHIHAATQHGNLHDSIRDRRHSFGERNGSSKLTDATALEALSLRAGGWSFRKIAGHLSVTHAAIEALCCGRTWKHLQRPPKRVTNI